VLYLLDANVLIRAHEDYYAIDRVPQFWEWLLVKAAADVVKLPFEIHGELAVSTKGRLKDWVTQPEVSKSLILNAQIDPTHLNRVVIEGYAPNLNDSEIEKIGRDPFLIGYGLSLGAEVTVVTKEVSAPSKQRANRKVPDVCKSMGVRCVNDFEFYREMDFRTN
jgi:hypothetical protein